MKNLMLILALLASSSSLNASQSDGDQKEQQKKWPYFKGIVVDFVTRNPIAGAKAAIEGTKLEATTNEKGEFEFEGLTPGATSVFLAHPRYRPLLWKNIPITNDQAFYQFLTMKFGSPNDKPLVGQYQMRSSSGIDEDAVPIQTREASYPLQALKDRVEGTVLLFVSVNEEGEVLYASVKDSVREDLNLAALEVAQYFKFKPAKAKGKAVQSTVTIPFKFKLADRSEGYPITAVVDPIGEHQMNRVLEFLDVKLERFAYNIPFEHGFSFSFAEFEDGKKTDRFIGGSTAKGNRAGRDTILLLIRKGPENTVKFEIHWANGAMKTGPVSLKSYGATKVTALPGANLKENSKMPIFVYAMNPRELPNDKPLPTFEYYIRKYRFVIALFTEMQPAS